MDLVSSQNAVELDGIWSTRGGEYDDGPLPHISRTIYLDQP